MDSQSTNTVTENEKKKERINTQIHRRRTVKAFSPLELEWESSKSISSTSTVEAAQLTKPE